MSQERARKEAKVAMNWSPLELDFSLIPEEAVEYELPHGTGPTVRPQSAHFQTLAHFLVLLLSISHWSQSALPSLFPTSQPHHPVSYSVKKILQRREL